MNKIRIGTRGSQLALYQANLVAGFLRGSSNGIEVEIRTIKTTGDKILDSPLSKIGDKGLFTKEIERALLEGEIDCAVHSLKDLPTQLPDGLEIAAFSAREDVRDALIAQDGMKLLELPKGSTVATGSLRRRSQLLHMRSDLNLAEMRGNLNTRLRKLEEEGYAGMMLAYAGIKRLGMADKVTEVLDPDTMLPAVGQGIIAVEARSGDSGIKDILSGFDNGDSRAAALAERDFLGRLEGGCQVPIGVYTSLEKRLLTGMVASLDGEVLIKESVPFERDNPSGKGIELAERLLSSGADKILDEIRAASDPRSSSD
ncbi:MAG: hydroxymethylbilane synthase [Bacteroidetes bacterium]|jgi:hydroxymethylbilane synthase|nr:hydroxymethylbilane synthase [Bacteroidota bacterium]